MGLLDSVFAKPGEDEKYAMNMGFFQGLINGNIPGSVAAAKKGLLDAEYQRAQIDETKAQAGERKAKMKLAEEAQARQDRFINGDGGGMSPGAYAPSADGSGPVMPPGQGQPQGGLLGQARAMGIPERAIQADMAFNNGKGIADMLFKRGTPDMQVANGFAYDKNRLGAGFMPFLNTSQSGQTSMGRIGTDGLPVVSAPQGALPTYRAYREADEGIKAGYDPMTIPPRAGQTNPTLTTRGNFVGGLNAPAPVGPLGQESSLRGAAAGPMGADPEALKREIQKTVQDLTIKQLDPASRKMMEDHVTGLSATLRSLNVQPNVQSMAGGIPLQSSAEKIASDETAKLGAERDNERSKRTDKAGDMVPMLTRARTLLENGDPTASGVGALADKGAAFFGRTSNSAQSAAALENIAGALTMSVPRMEGPQGVLDLQLYTTMAGKVGDRTVPVKERLAALEQVEILQRKYAGQPMVSPSKAASTPPPTPMKGMVRNGYKFNGGNPADPANWTKQ